MSTFIEHPTYQRKIEILRAVQDAYPHHDYFVETGLYALHGSGLELNPEHYVAIDVQRENCDAVKAARPDALVCCGSSAKLMPGVLAGVPHPAIFWLDAHGWQEEDFGENPLLEEIAAIRAWRHAASSVILIDDVRQLGDQPLAVPGWPTLAEVRDALGDIWKIMIEEDILRALPWGEPTIFWLDGYRLESEP